MGPFWRFNGYLSIINHPCQVVKYLFTAIACGAPRTMGSRIRCQHGRVQLQIALFSTKIIKSVGG